MLLGIKVALAALLVWLSIIVFRVVRFFKYRWYRVGVLRKLPGRRWHRVLGVLSQFPGPGEDGIAFLREYVKMYPRISYWYFGVATINVAVAHPDTVKDVMKTSDGKPVEFGFYDFLLPWLGDGLLTSYGRKWSRHRRLLTPAFHFDILKPYNDINNRATDTLLDKLDVYARSGDHVEVFSVISLCTLEVVLKCAFSFPDDVQKAGSSHPYVKAVNTLGSVIMFRAFNPIVHLPIMFWLSRGGRKFRRCCKFVHSVASDIIEKRRKTIQTEGLKAKSSKVLDFLDILLTARDDAGTGLTDREIRDEVDTFLFEGHDTTASGISWMLYSLAQNPDWQLRCQQEIDSVLEGRENDDILWNDLPKLKILTACLKEAMRLHSPVPIIERETSKDMYIDGYLIPRGTAIDILLYGIMHNEQVWEEPMVYKPERFLNDRESKDSFTFLPFSAGPRNCIGQNFAMHEMKTVVARIIRRFSLTPDPARPAKHKLSLVMRTEAGMYVKVTPRESASECQTPE